ncbi:LON peptidase substrate-binding domain-containing protein [Streptantibioticus silvisoli]|uniref:LON peptidase substrate-binding domain-containing protein n=1 Tax=Streptantibioticus silvisoli TaxID=2705255 RepID=A0ABT6VYQ4_9ACTN|nr:LON peptidase substrate-binding domain-containing protein [Streptantibioticus silvisoli]MDI5963612.1 LON peptidase substrate-binding domain-containing protein [Streptantibioticus silvisoli]
MTERLPLFPLGSVLFPGLVLPLHIFEDRYRALARDLLAMPEDASRRFGVVAIRDGREVAPTGPDAETGAAAGFGPDLNAALYPIGCAAEVASLAEKGDDEDDGYEMVATGTTRFRVVSLDATGPYLMAEVEELPEPAGDGAGELSAQVEQAFRTYQKQLAGASERTLSSAQELPDQPTVLSYLVAAATVIEVPFRQRLLEAADTASRLREELKLLRRETAVIGKLPSLPAVELTRRPTSHN